MRQRTVRTVRKQKIESSAVQPPPSSFYVRDRRGLMHQHNYSGVVGIEGGETYNWGLRVSWLVGVGGCPPLRGSGDPGRGGEGAGDGMRRDNC